MVALARSATDLLTWNKAPQWLSHQAAWWVCVLGSGWIRPSAMVVFILAHLWFMRTQWRRELQIIGYATLLGLSADTCLVALGAIEFGGSIRLGLVPLWMISLWAGFGATLLHSQRAMLKDRRCALLVGAFGGPAAYWGGERLGCLTISEGMGLFGVGCAWAIVLVTLEYILRRDEANHTAI